VDVGGMGVEQALDHRERALGIGNEEQVGPLLRAREVPAVERVAELPHRGLRDSAITADGQGPPLACSILRLRLAAKRRRVEELSDRVTHEEPELNVLALQVVTRGHVESLACMERARELISHPAHLEARSGRLEGLDRLPPQGAQQIHDGLSPPRRIRRRAGQLGETSRESQVEPWLPVLAPDDLERIGILAPIAQRTEEFRGPRSEGMEPDRPPAGLAGRPGELDEVPGDRDAIRQ
jgi:hypothetical protein